MKMISIEETKAMSIEIQEELKEFGYELDVVHNRIMDGFFAIDPETGELDNCLSRSEFANAVQNHLYQADYYMDDDKMKFGDYVSPFGGFTRVTLKKTDGTELHGKYNFNPNEPFFKANGVLRAVGKALKSERKKHNG